VLSAALGADEVVAPLQAATTTMVVRPRANNRLSILMCCTPPCVPTRSDVVVDVLFVVDPWMTGSGSPEGRVDQA
jgi:hypothetical protein